MPLVRRHYACYYHVLDVCTCHAVSCHTHTHVRPPLGQGHSHQKQQNTRHRRSSGPPRLPPRHAASLPWRMEICSARACMAAPGMPVMQPACLSQPAFAVFSAPMSQGTTQPPCLGSTADASMHMPGSGVCHCCLPELPTAGAWSHRYRSLPERGRSILGRAGFQAHTPRRPRERTSKKRSSHVTRKHTYWFEA